MAKINQYISLIGAGESYRIHGQDIQLPKVKKAKNFYPNRSDGLLAARGDMYRYRDDTYSMGYEWELTDPDNASDFVNVLITTDHVDTDVYLNRMFPIRASRRTPLVKTYTTGTISTVAGSDIITGNADFVSNVWGHCFLKIGTETPLYRIKRVISSTQLQMDVHMPQTRNSLSYTIYLTHDSDRALFPMHFEMFGEKYIYNASSPQIPDEESLGALSGPFIGQKQDYQTQASSQNVIPSAGEADTKYLAIGAWYLNSKYIVLTQITRKIDTSISTELAFLHSSDGVVWTHGYVPAALQLVGSFSQLMFDLEYFANKYWLITSVADGSFSTRDPGGMQTVVVTPGHWRVGYTSANIATHFGQEVNPNLPQHWQDAYAGQPMGFIDLPPNITEVSIGSGVPGVYVSPDGHITTSDMPFAFSPVIVTKEWIPAVTRQEPIYLIGSGSKFKNTVYASDNLSQWDTGKVITVSGDVNYAQFLRVCDVVQDGTVMFAFGQEFLSGTGGYNLQNLYLQTSDGITWTAVTGRTNQPGPMSGTNGMKVSTRAKAYATRIICISTDGYLYTSTNSGVNWTKSTLNTNSSSNNNLTQWDFEPVASEFVGISSATGTKAQIISSTDLFVANKTTTDITLSDTSTSPATTKTKSMGLENVLYCDTRWNVIFPLQGGGNGVIRFTNIAGLAAASQAYNKFVYYNSLGAAKYDFGPTCCSTTLIFVSMAAIGGTYDPSANTFSFVPYCGSTVTPPDTLDIRGSKDDQDILVAYNNGMIGWTKWDLLKSAKVYPTPFIDSTSKNAICAKSEHPDHTPPVTVIVGDSGYIYYSANNWDFTRIATGSAANFYGVTYGSGVFVIVGAGGAIYTSPDAITWTVRVSGTAQTLRDVCWTGNFFIAVGNSGTVLTSGTGVVWTARTSGVANHLNAVHFGYGTGYSAACGDGGVVIKSSNHGVTWTSVLTPSGSTADLNDITYTGFQWIAVGDSGATVFTDEEDLSLRMELKTATTSKNLYTVFAITYSPSTDPNAAKDVFAIGQGSVIEIQPAALASYSFVQLSPTLRANSFCIIAGRVLLLGVKVLEGTTWKYYPREIRWTAPMTYDQFMSKGSGAASLNGDGHILYGVATQDIVVVFESQGIGLLTPPSSAFDTFVYRRVADGIYTISNPIVVGNWVYFIASDGLIYRTNGVGVEPLDTQFDISKFTDLHGETPIWLAYNRYLRSLLVFRPDGNAEEHYIHIVDPETGACSRAMLPEASYGNYPRSLITVPTAYDVHPQTDPDDPATSNGTDDDFTGSDYQQFDNKFWIVDHPTKNILGLAYSPLLQTYVAVGGGLDAGDECVIQISGNGKYWEEIVDAADAPDYGTNVFYHRVVWDPINQYFMLIGWPARVLRSNNGIHWDFTEPAGCHPNPAFSGIAVNAATGTIMVCQEANDATPGNFDSKVWITSDAGSNWTEVTPVDIAGETGAKHIAYDPTHSRWYLACYDMLEQDDTGRVYISEDDGTTWEQVPVYLWNFTTNQFETRTSNISFGGIDFCYDRVYLGGRCDPCPGQDYFCRWYEADRAFYMIGLHPSDPVCFFYSANYDTTRYPDGIWLVSCGSTHNYYDPSRIELPQKLQTSADGIDFMLENIMLFDPVIRGGGGHYSDMLEAIEGSNYNILIAAPKIVWGGTSEEEYPDGYVDRMIDVDHLGEEQDSEAMEWLSKNYGI